MANLNLPILKMPELSCEEIKNTYTFTFYDENDEIIDTRIFHNKVMPMKYFIYDMTDLVLKIGTVTEKDLDKYKNSDGSWKLGYCANEDGVPGTAGHDGITKDSKLFAKDGWKFQPPKITSEDSGLWGSTVYEVNFNWSCKTISNNKVTFIGKNTIGYHDPASSFNDLHGAKKTDTLLNGGTVTLGTYGMKDGQWVLLSEQTYEQKPKERIFGINFTDAGLFGRNIMVSHFSMSGASDIGIVKRPVNYMLITVEVSFINLRLGAAGFTPFNPKGNLLYGHSTNINTGLCRLRPLSFGFSSYEIKGVEGDNGGCFPINALTATFVSSSKLTTDKPDDWNDKKDGTWNYFPHYTYFGNFKNDQPYMTKKVKVKKIINGVQTEVEEERVRLNKKGQKQINWSNLEDRGISTYGTLGCCPIRSFVINGYGARGIEGLIPATGIINYFQIGVGDGHTTTFYHSINSKIGTIINAYYTLGNKKNNASNITYYEHSDSFFSNGFLGVYDNNMNKICDANSRNEISDSGYDKENKCLHMGYQPFTMDYYTHSSFNNSLIGSNEWLVYEKTGTIKSAWIGMNEASNYATFVTLKTARSIDGLKNGRFEIIYNAENQHPQTDLDFESEGIVAVRGNSLWSMGRCYVGGTYYSMYDETAIRFSSSSEMPGYIKFEEAPDKGAKIYIDINFSVPFFGYFTALQGHCVNSFGSDKMNGRED